MVWGLWVGVEDLGGRGGEGFRRHTTSCVMMLSITYGCKVSLPASWFEILGSVELEPSLQGGSIFQMRIVEVLPALAESLAHRNVGHHLQSLNPLKPVERWPPRVLAEACHDRRELDKWRTPTTSPDPDTNHFKKGMKVDRGTIDNMKALLS